MDVRCERCKTQYVFDDDQVGEAGLTVRCSNCGHVFRVKKKALVVTVPVKPGELGETAPVATADIHRGTAGSAAAASARGDAERVPDWTLRKPNGDVYPFRDLSILQKWVVERKASREDEVSRQGEPWRRLAELPELEPFFAVIERADRGPIAAAPSVPAQGAATAPRDAQPTIIEFPQPRPVFPGPGHQPAPARTEPGFGPAVEGEGPVAGALPPMPRESWEAPAARSQAAPEPAWTADPDERPSKPEEDGGDGVERRSVKRSRFAPIAVVLGLFVATGLAVFLANPAWFGLEHAKPPPQPAAAPAPAQIPVTTEVPAKPPEPPPASATAAPAPPPSAPTATPSPNSLPPASAAPQPAPATPTPATPAPEATPSEQPKVAAAKPIPAPEKPAEAKRPRGMKGLLADAQRLRERGRAAEALDVYGRALELEPENANALAGRGLCYLELSQYAPAEASFQAALDTDAQHADALMGLAETYRYEGRRAEAVAYYQKYLAAHPDGEDAVAARNAIEALKE